MKQNKQTMLLFMLFLWLNMGLLHAQQVYTLDECINITLQKNLQIQNSQMDVQSTNSQIKEAKSSFLPTVELTGQYQYYLQMPKMLVPADFMPGGKPGEYIEMEFGSPQTMTAAVQATQVLYNQKVFIGLKAARTAKNMSDLMLHKTREDLIYNVSAIYYNLQVLNQNLMMLDSNIVSLSKVVQANSALEANSIVSKTNYKRLLISLENLKNERLNLALTTDKAYSLLKFLMCIPVTEQISISTFDAREYKLEAAVGNVENRTDIKLLTQQVELAKLDLKASKASFYPSLAGVVNYGVSGNNDKFSLTQTINDQWIRSSFVALQLNVPIFSGFSRTEKVRQKNFELKKAQNNYELMKSSVLKEMSDAVNNYNSSCNSFENTKRSLSLAQDIYNSAQIEYTNGLISASDLLLILNELTTARNNFSNALVNLRIAEIELKKSKGEIASK
ncbi:MAG: TolC family protein [Paludibacter sp.]